MKIIGHRGAAGLAPENTIAAIRAGIEAGADAVEFDVRLTSDGALVLLHDISLLRIAGINTPVKNLTLRELGDIKTVSGEKIPTLQEALKACGTVTAVIEPKGYNWVEPMVATLRQYQHSNKLSVITFKYKDLIRFHSFMPEIPCYILERQNAFKAIRLARNQGFTGVDMNFWILNPFSYFFALISGLKVLVYTIDRPIYMRYFGYFFPKVAITTNYPNLLKKISRRR